MAATHVTVRRNDDHQCIEDEAYRVGRLYRCPFCATHVYRPSERQNVLTHLQSHRLRAVHPERIVDWKSVSPDVRKMYRVEFELTRCDGCGCIYKNTTGYCGNGKKRIFRAFYSDRDFDGFCSMDCYYSMNE